MIDVIATITIKDGCRDTFVERFQANLPNVHAEEGCVAYYPALDVATDIGAQLSDTNTVTVIEKWESLDSLKAHLTAPHMATYRETVKDLVEDVMLRVVEQAR